MLKIDKHPEGITFSVKVHAGARSTGVEGVEGDLLKIRVSQAPEKGKANKVVITVLAEALGMRKSQLELLAGETSPRKKILARDLTAEELRRRLAGL